MSIIRDISQRRREERERERLQAQLQQAQKMQAVGTLASGIAHDFNNILQAISGYVQLMLEGPALSPEAIHANLVQVDQSVVKASSLVRRLLTFSRKVEPQLSPTDLNQEIRDTVSMLKHTLPKMISIELDLEDGLGAVRADQSQLAQILLNLANNARDAMEGGGTLSFETKRVTLETEFGHQLEPGHYVRLVVRDTGRGMSPEVRDHIFEPFFTTKEVGAGTGLGLSTVYGIVHSHQGAITCYSEPGLGSEFHIYLPLMRTGESGARRDEAPVQQPPGGHETILVVDDEETIIQVATETLKHHGYTTLHAASGEQALEVYTSRGDIDLVVMDLGMPGMGGARCMEEILRHDPAAKVIIASGYSGPNQGARFISAGAKAFISKPYRLQGLVSAVRGALDGKPPQA